MEMTRIERLLRTVSALEFGGCRDADDLMVSFGVSRRTVFRDLALLARSGFRYIYDRQERRYSADPATRLSSIRVSPAEALELVLMANQAVAQRCVLDEAAARSASLKLKAALPELTEQDCHQLVEHIEVVPEAGSDTTSIRDALVVLKLAIFNRQKLRAAYDSHDDSPAVRKILHPYHLVYVCRGWHLIALDEESADVRTFKVERIVDLRILDVHFETNPAFDLRQYFGNAWQIIRGGRLYHVKIRFTKEVASEVGEVDWHKTQHTTCEWDGAMVFEADVDGLDEICSWILGYGEHAHVLEPTELRELIAERVRRTYAYYNGTMDSAASRIQRSVASVSRRTARVECLRG